MHLGIYFCCIVLFTPGCFEDGFCLLRISQVINIRRRRTLSLSLSLPRRQSLTYSLANMICVCVYGISRQWKVRERERKNKLFCESRLQWQLTARKYSFVQKGYFLAENNFPRKKKPPCSIDLRGIFLIAQAAKKSPYDIFFYYDFCTCQ